MNYYNDNDPYVCEWLRNLIDAGQIPPGEVDDRDIRLVRPDDLGPYTQCHFFAGIGGWPLALQMSGYEGLVCWTGSCPCQDFSLAGKQAGIGGDRDLWPEWFRLISKCAPDRIFGEQVVDAAWLDRCCDDLESIDYTCGAVTIPACAVGAPHERERLWFVAYANGPRPPFRQEQELLVQRQAPVGSDWWASEPDVVRVVHGFPGRVDQIRALGNAIVPQVAAEFIKAAMTDG